MQRSVPVLGAIVDADIRPTRRARPGPVPARRVVPASVEKFDLAAPPFTQPTAERGPSDRQRVVDGASSRWVVWMLVHRGSQVPRPRFGCNHEKGEEALETPQAGRYVDTAYRRSADLSDLLFAATRVGTTRRARRCMAATLELLRPLSAACAFHAKHQPLGTGRGLLLRAKGGCLQGHREAPVLDEKQRSCCRPGA